MTNEEFQMIAVVLASGGQVVIDKQHKAEAVCKRLQIDHRKATGETVLTVANLDDYGQCPHCRGKVVQRERRLNGNDTCENGHVYPSRASYN